MCVVSRTGAAAGRCVGCENTSSTVQHNTSYFLAPYTHLSTKMQLHVGV